MKPFWSFLIYVLASCLLLILSFPYTGSLTPLIFVGFLPLLILREKLIYAKIKPWKFGVWTYLTFLIWNIGTTWWVAKASFNGAILAFGINSLLMSLIFGFWSCLNRKIKSNYTFWLLIPLWILFEFGHHRWDLSWPWLTLGNYFSIQTNWVQWYEWTGTLGGSAWVLTMNLLAFKVWERLEKNNALNKTIAYTAGLLLLPFIISYTLLTQTFNSNQKEINVLVLQPNIDPYTEKFSATASNETFTDTLLILAKRHLKDNTDLVLAPETALPLSFLENRFHTFDFGNKLLEQIAKWPVSNMLIGASTVKVFDTKQSSASTPIPSENRWYESYNSSILLTKNKDPQFVHKSKLVPGVELIPFSSYLPFLSAIAIENGGTSGTLGVEKTPKIVRLKSNDAIAPIICYESIYGDFVRRQVQKGAQLLCIITNDGWWGDTPGYKQHFSFSRLRAIETRRWLLRSANTGKSGCIDPLGKVVKETPYWTKTAFSQKVNLRSNLTFYSKYGDWVAGISVSWLLFAFSLFFMEKAKNIRNFRR